MLSHITFSWYIRGIPLKLTDLYYCPCIYTRYMFIGLLIMNHHTSLMIPYFLACVAVLTDFLVAITPDFILYRLRWADPTRNIRILLSCGRLLFNPAILSVPLGRVLCNYMFIWIYQVLNPPYMIYLRLQRYFHYL